MRPPAGAAHEVEAALHRRRAGLSLDARLDRIDRLTGLLGWPQDAFPVVHVAGTNGKTSTTRMIEALLRARGLRTGMFTGPELREMRERIALGGAMIGPDEYVAAYRRALPYAEEADRRGPGRVSFFELLTAMAFDVFARSGVDVAVVEAGLGGARDATNVADGRVAVVTPVSLDHTRLLGGDVAAIAGEKAGIIKPGSTAVLARQPKAAAGVLRARAAEVRAAVLAEDRDFGVIERRPMRGGQVLRLHDAGEVFLPLLGAHQAQNAACAVAAARAFAARAFGGGVPEPSALRAVASPGRLEIVRAEPPVIVDAAHNPAGMAATAAAIKESYGRGHLIGVLAVMADKDVTGLVEPLADVLGEVVVTSNAASRSMPVAELRRIAEAAFPPGAVHAVDDLREAIELALSHWGGVLVTGSVRTAGEARELLS